MAIKYLNAKRIRGLTETKKETKVGQAGNSDSDNEVWANATIGECTWKKITGLTAGDSITHMIYDIYDWNTMEGKFALYTDGDDDLPEARIGNVVTQTLTQTNTSSDNPKGYMDEYYTCVYVPTSGSPVVPSDGIVWVGIHAYNDTTFHAKSFSASSNVLNSVYDSSQAYSSTFPSTVTASSGGSNSFRFGVRTTGGDTKPTNVPSNTIFEQTDNYKYQWFDGSTWTGQPSTNVIAFGGTDHQTETWDGIAWLLRGDMPLTKRELNGGGSTTDALAIDGYGAGGGTQTAYHTKSCFEWNGTAWSSTGNDTYERRNLGDGGGTNGSDGWCAGGKIAGTASDKTTNFNGSSWSTSGDLTASSTTGVGGGSSTNSLYAKELLAQTYNGSTWTNIASLSNANSSNGTKQGGGDGNADNFFCAGGEGTGGSAGNATSFMTHIWNGTVWSQGASLPDGTGSVERAGYGDCQGAGNKDKYQHISGSGGPPRYAVDRSYFYDGTSWTRSSDMNYKRSNANAGMGDV